MKTGRTLTELAAEITRQSQAKRDFLADTREMVMLNANELHLPNLGEFGLRDTAHQQLAAHLAIPGAYYSRLRSKHPELLDHNVNQLFRLEPSTRMVRTLDGQARAFLSNRYQRRDNDELAEAILPILGGIPDVQFPSCEITENRLYIKAVSPRIQGEVNKGDVVQAGVVISNSEVGQGSLQVQPMIFRLVCLNGMIAGTGIRRYHVGRRVDSDEAQELFRDATLRADDRAFWMKVADVVTASVTEVNFQRLLQKMQVAAGSTPMPNPSAGVQELAGRYQLTETETDSVLHHLTMGGDLTRWGALNAVTRTASDVDDYDRATELEEIGGAILDMGEREWAAIGATATPAGSRQRRRQTVPVTADALVDAIG